VSGPARTADVIVKMRIRVTDTATEGEMVDHVLDALRRVQVESVHENATLDITEVGAAVITKHTGGSL